MFKRDLQHSGLADELAGAVTQDNVCVRWSRRVSPPGLRSAGGPVVAEVDGIPTLLVATQGSCNDLGEACTADPPGTVWSLDGDDGSIAFATALPAGSQADPYAPLLADVDADGALEVVVPNDRSRADGELDETHHVYAYRVSDEPGGARGTLQWTFSYQDDTEISEGAPTAAQLIPSTPALEIVLGSDNRGGPARVYAIDGASGAQVGEAFVVEGMNARDPECPPVNKADSGSAAIWADGAARTMFLGGWGGRFFALEWRDAPAPGLYAKHTHELPDVALECSVRKVRNSPSIGQIVEGGVPEVVFGYMPEPNGTEDPTGGYASARVRVLSALDLSLIDDVDMHDWKSSPSMADLDPVRPGLEIAAGRVEGYYALGYDAVAGALTPLWAEVTPGVAEVGNRSSPAIADIDGDGDLDVVFGIERGSLAGITAVDGASGAVVWRWLAPDTGDPSRGVTGSPALADVDGDGALEVAFLGLDGVVVVLDSDCP